MSSNKKIIVGMILGLLVVMLGSFLSGLILISYFYDLQKVAVGPQVHTRLIDIDAKVTRLSNLNEELLQRNAELIEIMTTPTGANFAAQAFIAEVVLKETVETEYTIMRLLPGDTVWSSLRRLGIEPTVEFVDQILRLNGIVDDRSIPKGTYLKIPVEKIKTSPEVTLRAVDHETGY